MSDTTRLDYQELHTISPKAARQAILQILKANKGNVVTGVDTMCWLSTKKGLIA